MDLALQGPQSLPILSRLIDDEGLRRRLRRLRRFEFVEGEVGGLKAIISRTGYTGEEWGFELYVHPDDALILWGRLLEMGQELGLKPAGLGARDSTRTEAGLPLYGQELAGPHHISPIEAGYGPFVKFHKPFFVGRKPLLEKERERKMEVIRFRLNSKGGPVLRPGDPVVDRRGRYIGSVTSCALVDGYQLGLAYVERKYNLGGTQIGLFASPKRAEEKPISQLALGDVMPLHQEATVLSRFPAEREKEEERGKGVGG
jgi:glycine hydroxymethyltransferase